MTGVYSDDSKIGIDSYAGAGVYCQTFAHYIPIGAEGTAFEGEVNAIKEALLNLIPRILSFNQAIILVNSKASHQTSFQKCHPLQNADRYYTQQTTKTYHIS